jgi:hypothetical protein
MILVTPLIHGVLLLVRGGQQAVLLFKKFTLCPLSLKFQEGVVLIHKQRGFLVPIFIVYLPTRVQAAIEEG